MKLQDLNFENPLITSIYGERYINDTKGSFNDYSQLNPIYDPQGDLQNFHVPFSWIKEKELEIYRSSPDTCVLQEIYNGSSYKFFWHPDTIRKDLTINGYQKMQPTSSARTMLEMERKNFYVKTDLDKKHFRFIRRLKKDSVIHSIAICDDLRELCSTLPYESRYSFLPESLGIVIAKGLNKGSGCLFRETKPFPLCHDRRITIPYHSLYADDVNDEESRPLLVQLCEKHAQGNPLDFFLENIIGPVQDAWVLLVSKRGLLPELHGQNSLIEIDENFFPRRLVHRDFQGTYSDSEIRLQKKYSLV